MKINSSDPKSQYLEQIKALAPDLVYQTAFLDDSGQFNDVLILDNAWVFRFPRYGDGVRHLEAETYLLLALRSRLPLSIPDPIYFCFSPPEPRQAFMGYRRLPGEPLLKPGRIREQAAVEHMAGQLANFLRSLHAIPAESIGVELGTVDGVNNWARMYGEIHEKLFPVMRPDARAQVTHQFENYLGDLTLQTFTPVLRHGDFGGSNILYDPYCESITGVLDFGFCALGDPAVDLASASTLGEPFFALIAQAYEPDQQVLEPLLARARFYRATFALEEALDGFNRHDRRALENGLREYI